VRWIENKQRGNVQDYRFEFSIYKFKALIEI
jgi:hypothetical protein